MRENVQLIKNHPFFKGIDWESIGSPQSIAPFIPKLQNEMDTSYFDADQQSGSANNSESNHHKDSSNGKGNLFGSMSEEEERKILELRKELAFVGFTYRGYPNAYKMRQRYIPSESSSSQP